MTSGKFTDKYTTTDKKKEEPVKEKDKVVVTNDTYATCELLERLIRKIK